MLFCSDYFRCGQDGIKVVRGSLLRKITVAALQLALVPHIFHVESFFQIQRSENIDILTRGITLVIVLNDLCQYWCLNYRWKQTGRLLNQLHKLEQGLRREGAELPGPSKAKAFSWLVVAFHAAFVIGFTLSMRLNIIVLFNRGFSAWWEDLAEEALAEYGLFFGSSGGIYNTSDLSATTKALAALPYITLSFLYDLSWTIEYAFMFLFGLVFIMAFKSFYNLLEGAIVSTNTSQAICKFNEITFVLDGFNDAFGALVLGSVVSGVAYFSVVFIAVSKSGKGTTGYVLSTTLCFLLYGVQLLAAAEVSRSAGKMKKILKTRFNSRAAWNLVKHANTDATQGLIILFTELTTENIGFEGMGFFTLTYSLIGSVVSLIATWAIVALQLS